MTPDEVLDLQHQIESILTKHNVKTTGCYSVEHCVDDYIYCFKLVNSEWNELRSTVVDDIAKLGYHFEWSVSFEDDAWTFVVSVCYPDD